MRRCLTFFGRYPAAAMLICLSGGIFTARAMDLPIFSWAAAGLLAALGIVFFSLRVASTGSLWVGTGLLFYFAGLTFACHEFSSGAGFQPHAEKRVIHATVLDMTASSPDRRVMLVKSGIDIEDGSELPGIGRLLLRDNDLSLVPGDRIAFRTGIKKPLNRGNPGEFNWEIYCKDSGISWQASAVGQDGILFISRGSRWHPRAMLFRLRDAMTRFFGDHSQGDARAVLRGIVLGDRGEISPDLNVVFAESGLIHILSASGVHVGIVALFSAFAVWFITLPLPRLFLTIPRKKLAAAVAVPAMLGYCLIVGARTPAIRATIMGVVIASAIIADRKWHSLNSLVLAALIILLVYPLSIFTVEFQLSFAAVLGILLTLPYWMRRLDALSPVGPERVESKSNFFALCMRGLTVGFSGLMATLLTSLSATFAVSPFLLRTFHFLPLYTLGANLATGFLVTLALPLGLLAAILGIIHPGLGALILIVPDYLLQMVVVVARFFSALPASRVNFPNLTNAEFLAATVSGFLILWFIGRALKYRRVVVCSAGIIFMVSMFLLPWIRSLGDELKVVFINVGRGDASFVAAPGSKGLLIDGGVRSEHFDAGDSIVVPFLGYMGVRSLDGILISLPHMDHAGGLGSVTRRIPCARLWWNPTAFEPPFLKRLFENTGARGTKVLPADRACAGVELGKATLTFLNPPGGRIGTKTEHRDVNNASVVCRLDYRDVSFLFTGDIEAEAEEELLAAGIALEATVLKVAHHGGNRSSSQRFLDAVRPKIAVISSDHKKPGSGLNQQVLRRLEGAAEKVFWTGRDGAVTIETNGKHITVKTGRTGACYSIPDTCFRSEDLQRMQP